MHLSATGDLINSLPVGTKVTVDYVDNAIPGKEDAHFFEDCPAKFVALLVYTGVRPEVPELIFEEANKATEKFYLARIVQFNSPGETGVEGGVAELVPPSQYNHLVKGLLKNRLATDGVEEMKKIRFHRSVLFHLGCHLGKADLRYLFSANCPTMGTLFCRVKAVKGDKEVGHEMTVGWKASHLSTHLSMPSGFIFRAANVENTLLFPALQWAGQKRQMNLKALTREQWDLRNYMDVVEGRARTFDKVKEEAGENFDFARISDLLLLNMGTNLSVNCGIVTVESGEHAGQKAFFNRNNVSLFGFKLDKANLNGLLDQNEPVWVRLGPSDSKKEHQYKIRVLEMYLGWPHRPDQTVESMQTSETSKFLLYLDNKGLTVPKFLDLLRKPATEHVFSV